MFCAVTGASTRSPFRDGSGPCFPAVLPAPRTPGALTGGSIRRIGREADPGNVFGRVPVAVGVDEADEVPVEERERAPRMRSARTDAGRSSHGLFHIHILFCRHGFSWTRKAQPRGTASREDHAIMATATRRTPPRAMTTAENTAVGASNQGPRPDQVGPFHAIRTVAR